jgi:hypothetical protein
LDVVVKSLAGFEIFQTRLFILNLVVWKVVNQTAFKPRPVLLIAQDNNQDASFRAASTSGLYSAAIDKIAACTCSKLGNFPH